LVALVEEPLMENPENIFHSEALLCAGHKN
jgi:hypothetical protein